VTEVYDILKDDDPHYTKVGQLASVWAYLEMLLDGSIRKLLDSDEQGAACITAQLIGPANRFNALLALVRLRGGSEQLTKDLDGFAGRVQQLGTERNRIVHDPIFMHERTGKVHAARASARRFLIFGFEPVSEEEIRKVIKRIEAAISELITLRGRIAAETDSAVAKAHQQTGEELARQNPPKASDIGN
jgi:hypothetical protein